MAVNFAKLPKLVRRSSLTDENTGRTSRRRDHAARGRNRIRRAEAWGWLP